IRDSSGLAGCSGYDVDGDGAYEVLYADEDNLRIYDGSTGAVNYINGNHSSGTVWEYPVTADVDNDGSAEIVIASNGTQWRGITVFGHTGDGWPKSGTTWGTHDFAVTNLNPDGSVPSPPEASWQKYNVFRARPSVDDPAYSDLVVELVDFCVGTCAGGPARISYRVYNQGAVDVEAGSSLTLYMVVGGVEVPYTTVTLPAVPAGQALPSEELVVQPTEIGDGGFVLSVDDDGSGRGVTFECDEDNNRFARMDPVCQ
ncbi:MAG TPA: VCBS repeat-containing protein, partial [Myxococcota bacterium]|nr:VCBS repeat-containing protein [Myxococcota bacterium]